MISCRLFSSVRQRCLPRRGNITVLTAMLMMFLIGLVAIVIDLGYTAHVKTQLGRAVDAGALAGAGALTEGEQEATNTALEFVQRNRIGSSTIPSSDVSVLLGEWSEDQHAFQESAEKHTAIQVACVHDVERRFFAKFLGSGAMRTAAAAVAIYQPRDIMLVLDYSAVMNDDSEFTGIAHVGRVTVEDNLEQIYNELGSPQYGNLTVAPRNLLGLPLMILGQLGLTSEPYPGTLGSWLEYILFVLTDPTMGSEGYRGDFSYATLMNYWQAMRPSANETPGLWMTSQQPLTAVKDSVEEFMDELIAQQADDRAGLVIFAANGNNAKLELGLGTDLLGLTRITRERQAAHYEKDPKMAAGLAKAIQELTVNGRPGAEKLIILISDGNAARKGKEPQNAAMDQARIAESRGVSIITMSLGPNADQSLMQRIADTSGGKHMHIVMGSTPAEYTEEIKSAFQSFANARKARLVQ